MQFSENFSQALQDYLYLLNNKYPEKTIHEMVSTRFALNHFERSMLYRGIMTSEKAEKRKTRLLAFDKLINVRLHIDLFNVLFTIAAYLRGFPVYRAMDGLVRDASEGHDTAEWVTHLEKALDLLLKHVDELQLEKAAFYLDNPLHLSNYVAREIEKKGGSLKTEVEIVRHESPDHLIRAAEDGILATSDSTIIDHSSLPVFDLPGYMIRNVYGKEILPLH